MAADRPAFPALDGAACTSEERPVVVFAIDEAYAMPLATAMRSIVEANAGSLPFDFRVLIEDISAATRDRVEKSLPTGAASIRWIQIDLGALGDIHPAEYASGIINARLLIPRLVTDVARVLYLDADILVLGRLDSLWNEDLRGAPVGAVLDGMDERLQAGDPSLAGLPRVRRYFNSGVMLIDLEAWRDFEITERAIDYLRRCPQARYPDQDALNWALDGDWIELDPRWNCQAHLHNQDLVRMPPEKRPHILHFVTAGKPWNAWVPNANAGVYDAMRAQTLFARGLRDRMRDLALGIGRRIKEQCKRSRAGLVIYETARQLAGRHRGRSSRRVG